MKAIKYALLGLIGVIGMLVSMFGPVRIPFTEGLAKSYYRYALGGVLVVLMLILIIVGLFFLTFNANNFKSEIIQFVKDRTQRELVLQGDIKVTFLPKLGLDSGKLSISQRNSAKEFATVNNARFYIAWWPLFKRQLVFDRVEIDGIHANVVRLKDGTTNLDDLLIRGDHQAPMTFNIDSLHITNSSIKWQDDLESQRLLLHGLQLDTGRLADTVPSNMTASFQLDSERAHVNSTVQLKSRLFFDRTAGRYEFADIEGKLQGSAAQLSNLSLDFKANLDAYPAQGTFTLEDLIVDATGKYSQRDFLAKLVAPSLKVINNNYSGSQLTLDASLTQSKEFSTVSLQLPAFEVAKKVFNAELSADFDYKADARILHGKLSTPLNINFEAAPVIQLDAFAISLTGNHPILSNELTAIVTGSMRLDYAVQSAKIVFKSKFEDSQISGTVAINDFSHPVYAVDIRNDHLDLNRYLAAEWTRQLLDDANTFSTVGLKDVTLQGSLRSGEIKIDKFKVGKLAANLKIEKSIITVFPLTASLNGGELTGNISVTALETPTVTVKQSLRGVQMGVLLEGTPNAGRLVGKGSLDLEMNAQGSSIGALYKALNGNASLVVVQGALAGINLRSALIEGKSDLGTKNAKQIRLANFAEKTQFSELKTIFNFKDGKISGTGFDMKSPLIRTAGEGEINLDSGNFQYRLNATVSSAINRRTSGELIDFKGVTVPIRVSGPYLSPSIEFDFAAASGGSISKIVAAHAAKAAAADGPETKASVAAVQRKKKSGISVTSKSRTPADKPVRNSQP